MKRTIVRNLGTAGLLAVLCTVIVLTCGQSGNNDKVLSMRQYLPQLTRGWELQDTIEMYDRETIFDYINGAGEVYLSFDFKEVAVFQYTRADQPTITVELFDMGTAEDAYGVFSYAREEEGTGVGGGYELRGGLLCFWKANFFACIRAEKAGPAANDAVYTISRRISELIPISSTRPDLVKMLPTARLNKQTIRFLHKSATLNYHYFLAEENVLNLSKVTRAVLAEYKPGPVYLLCIQYPAAQMAEAGYNGFIDKYVPEAKTTGAAQIEQGKWVAARLEREFVVVILDAPAEERANQMIDDMIKNLPGETE
jgi:hypothetical protein